MVCLQEVDENQYESLFKKELVSPHYRARREVACPVPFLPGSVVVQRSLFYGPLGMMNDG